MKRLIIVAICLLFLAIDGHAQCTASPGYQCVPQETFNRINKGLDELAASRDLIRSQADLIAKQAIALATSEGKSAAADAVIAKANAILDLDSKMFSAYDKVLELYQKTLDLYATIVEKLTAQINKPKSAWAKFVDVVKTVVTLAAGIAIGRGIP